MGKIDFKKQLSPFYSAGPEPQIVDVPALSFAMVDGHGDPNTAPAYAQAVQALYAVSYAAKFALKRDSGTNYTVMPLEGLWSVPDMSKFSVADKSAWDWTLMIMQPDEVTPQVFEAAVAKAGTKTPVKAIRLEQWAEGQAVQLLHLGPYAAEGPSIKRLHDFVAAHGLSLSGRHHEVYLGDPRRVAPAKLRTILRQPVTR